MEFSGLTFHITCRACPEQYDVYDKNNQQVGYVRLRWGCVTCEVPDVFGEVIYSASVGNGWTGMFENDEQRNFHLRSIANAILDYMEDNGSYAVFLYEDDGITTADLATYYDKSEAISFCKERGWDEVVNDESGEVVWRK